MCSVSGLVVVDPSKAKEAAVEFAQLMVRAADRGRDSHGVEVINEDGTRQSFKSLGRPGDELKGWLSSHVTESTRVLVA